MIRHRKRKCATFSAILSLSKPTVLTAPREAHQLGSKGCFIRHSRPPSFSQYHNSHPGGNESRCSGSQSPVRERLTVTYKTSFQILWDSTPFALPLLLLLVSGSVSIRWVIGLSRLVGVASGGFSRGWRHVRIGHRNSAASIDAKLGSVGDVSCVWRLFVAVSCGKTASWPRNAGVRAVLWRHLLS